MRRRVRVDGRLRSVRTSNSTEIASSCPRSFLTCPSSMTSDLGISHCKLMTGQFDASNGWSSIIRRDPQLCWGGGKSRAAHRRNSCSRAARQTKGIPSMGECASIEERGKRKERYPQCPRVGTCEKSQTVERTRETPKYARQNLQRFSRIHVNYLQIVELCRTPPRAGDDAAIGL